MREKWFCDALHADCGELFADDELELVVADGYAVRELAVVLREGDRDEGHLTAIGRQSPWGFGDAASSRVKCD